MAMTENDARQYLDIFTQEQKDEIVVRALIANSKRYHEGAPAAADSLYSYVRGLVRAAFKANRAALKRDRAA